MSFPNNYCILDFEGSGNNSENDGIIEVGIIRYKNQKEAARFSSLVKQNVSLSWRIKKITGITDQLLKNKPTIDQIAPSMLEFIGSDPVFGFGINYDQWLMKHELKKLGLPPFQNQWIDLQPMIKMLTNDENVRSLSHYVELYNFPIEKNHRAIFDCESTQALFLIIRKLAKEQYGSEDQFLEQYQAKRPLTFQERLEKSRFCHKKFSLFDARRIQKKMENAQKEGLIQLTGSFECEILIFGSQITKKERNKIIHTLDRKDPFPEIFTDKEFLAALKKEEKAK